MPLSDNSFRTICNPPKPRYAIDLKRQTVMLGSCFTDNIGRELTRRHVNVLVNPCGTLFNPMSILSIIQMAADGATPEFEEKNGLWFSWMLPGEFSSTDREEAERKAAGAVAQLREALLKCGTLIITFGTAIVYGLARPPFSVVANCHKFPSAEFYRDYLTAEAIIQSWERLIDRLTALNPHLKVIFTVSPVRHLKEGMSRNTISKAILHLAVYGLVSRLGNCEYFPAYEIFIDDLRDYRFCAADMQHPSQQAVEYIYGKFENTYFTDADRRLLDEALKITLRCEHRPLHPDTPEAKRFAAETERLLDRLLATAPFLQHKPQSIGGL